MKQQSKTAVVWSQEYCSYCESAKNLLQSFGYDVEERKIGEGGDWTKQDLIEVVPHARSVPQIFIDGQYIGGFQELRKTLTARE